MADDPVPDDGQASEFGVSFVSFPGADSVEIVDPIERHRYRLTSSEPVSISSADPDQFRFPVEEAVTFETTEIELPSVVAIYVRTADGELVAEAEHFANESVPDGSYILEICSPIKLYVELQASVSITSTQSSMVISFDKSTQLHVGARSTHDRPACTITTTDRPDDMMAAISTFGSALKSTSPERSFPTLRGHPPTVELGDEVEIPDELSPPETGVTIEVPSKYSDVFTVASLAYYLGASVSPGERPRIVTDHGLTYDLERPTLTDGVEEVLKQTFLLDCVTRTEGLYEVDLFERSALEERVTLQFDDLYNKSLARRLETYLEIPYSVVDDLVPQWGRTAHMLPDPNSVEVLPYLVDDLSLIEVHDPGSIARPDSPTATAGPSSTHDSTFTRSTGGAVEATTSFVQPPQSDSIEQVWVGDGTPIGASKGVRAAFENRLDRTPETGDIDITVVCNDLEMNEEEDRINDIYGSRDDLPFDLTVKQSLTIAELRDTLYERTDFLHYIGHIDDEGFDCADGKLDISQIEDVGVSAFLLNACQSYSQGRYLIEAGSIGGIVTLSEVINSGAVEMGKTLAKLLNSGFPLYAALGIARGESLMGGRYTVIGDGRMALTQPKSLPHLLKFSQPYEPDSLAYIAYPNSRYNIGSMTLPYIGDNTQHFLVGREITELEPSFEELIEFFELENTPVSLDDELRWGSEFS